MDRQGGLCLRRGLEWLLQCDGLCRQRQLLPALCRSVTLSRPRRIVQTGRSSMNILVTVRSGTIASTLLNQSTECLLILATTDANGRPTPVATWTAATEEDHQRQTAALQLKKNAQRH
jgi:hypothetical protein